MNAALNTYRNTPGINATAHEDAHGVRVLMYTSTATLTTTAGTEIYAPFGGELSWVSASVKTAPTSTMTIDVLLDGSSVFSSGGISIPTSQKHGYRTPVDKLGILPIYSDDPTPIKVQITNVAGATGPMIVYFGISTTEI
jgi:hypothetical protein